MKIRYFMVFIIVDKGINNKWHKLEIDDYY